MARINGQARFGWCAGPGRPDGTTIKEANQRATLAGHADPPWIVGKTSLGAFAHAYFDYSVRAAKEYRKKDSRQQVFLCG